MRDKRDVGGAVDADDTPLAALLLDAGENLAQDVSVRHVHDVLVLVLAEGGGKSDDDLAGLGALLGLADLGEHHALLAPLGGRGRALDLGEAALLGRGDLLCVLGGRRGRAGSRGRGRRGRVQILDDLLDDGAKRSLIDVHCATPF